MIYTKQVTISKADLLLINKYLSGDISQGEDNNIVYGAIFNNHIQMDIKCCGCQDPEDPSWAEAVLFYDGYEVACTDVSEEILGEWRLCYDGDTYICNAVEENSELKETINTIVENLLEQGTNDSDIIDYLLEKFPEEEIKKYLPDFSSNHFKGDE